VMLAFIQRTSLVVFFIIAWKVSDGHTGPQILSQPTVYRVHLGSQLKLSCNVSQLSDSVLLWKQGSRIIYAGEIKVRRDDRFAKVGNNLIINGILTKDDGDFTCEVETKDKNNPQWITHKVVVLQKPQIVTSHDQANLTVIKGSSLTLKCEATGNPRPSIIWSKHNRDLEGVEHRLSADGQTIELENMTISHGGRYTCTADNGVGDPVTEQLHVTVLYPPSTKPERRTILGGEGCSVELICQVEGFPIPSVHWYQGTMKLVPNNNIRMVTRGMRNVLTIVKFSFQERDRLDYTCTAVSDLGSSEANFTITGAPGTPRISHNITEVDISKYKFNWLTPSFTNILEHLLIYKQVKDKKTPSLLTYGENKLNIPNMEVFTLQCNRRHQPFQHKFEFILDKLEPLTQYQVILKARNKHGWSQLSNSVVFKTSQYLIQPPQESQILPLSGAESYREKYFSITAASIIIIFICDYQISASDLFIT